MRTWLIQKLGGYPDVDTALYSLRAESVEVRQRVLTLAVKKLFNTIGADDIFSIHESGHWMFEGKPIRPEEVKLLKAEAMQFQNSFLWRVLQKELKYQANKKMFIESREVIDMVAGKLLVYYIDIISTRLKHMLK